VRERAALGRSGVAFVTLVLDARGALAARPEVALRGVPLEHDETLLRAATRAAAQVVNGASDAARSRPDDLAAAVRLAVRKAIELRTRSKPVVQVLVARV
jgi:ribonuclease J